MSDTYYRLKICCDRVLYPKNISNILRIKPSFIDHDWYLDISEESHPSIQDCASNYPSEPVTPISFFLDFLENNHEKLSSIGVNPEDITVWFYYAYEGQCNIECYPNETKRLGDNGVIFCITCWETETDSEL